VEELDIMPRRSRFQDDAPVSLRGRANSAPFTPEQLAYIGAFIVALLAGGKGAYALGRHEGTNIRLQIYDDGTKYGDEITPQDDIAYLLHDYAQQFGVLEHYQRVAGALHGGPRQVVSKSTGKRGGSQDTPDEGSTPLRPGQ
jgi:hypothetical protein